MNIPKEIKLALDLLTNNHYEAYVVGGAVRDYLLNKKPSDYDITTNATPDEIMTIFKGYQIIDQGLKHGTVMVIINRKLVEITTFRVDEEYIDNRHPSKVRFTRCLREDLARRDFTINAFAYYHDVIDYFNGKEDLQNRIIRAVGNPDHRFMEDALRILRAIRFSCQLDFDIEDNTKEAIFKHKELLKNISVERIVLEFNKMLISHVERMIPFYSVFNVFIPEMQENIFQENIKHMKFVENKLVLRLALFLNNINDFEQILKRLKYPVSIQKEISVILKNKNLNIYNEKIAFKKLLKVIKYEDLVNIIMFKKALGEKVKYDMIEDAKNECHLIKDLDINGYDLVNLGVPNKLRNNILNNILDLIIENKIENKKAIIIDYIKSNLLN